jgi:hypothetical protein
MSLSHVPVAHACNPSYSGGKDQDRGSKPAQANNSGKYPSQNRAAGEAQVIELLPSKREVLSSNSSTTKKKKPKKQKTPKTWSYLIYAIS